MMRFFLLVALVSAVVAFPPVSTRENCPPEGYTAIAGSWKLDNLPPKGKYAICLTPAQAIELGNNADTSYDFTWAGTFRLTQSTLFVDENIRLLANYPARVDWNGVTVRNLPEEFHLTNNGFWEGVELNGAPGNIDASQTHYMKNKKIGNCGTLNKVDMEGMGTEPYSALVLNNCSGSTKLNEISIIQPRNGGDNEVVNVHDCHQLIFNDLTLICNTDCIIVDKSEAAFLRPYFADLRTRREEAFDLENGSNITVCDSTINARVHFEIGDLGEFGVGSVALAGRYNSHFPQDFDFQNNGGVLYILKKCPPKFASGYEMKLWEEWYTGDRR